MDETLKRPRRDLRVGFPTGRDSATFWDRGTEVPSLSWDKETTAQVQNLAMGRDEPGHCQNPGQDAGRDNHYVSVKIWGCTWDGTEHFCSCPCPGTKGQRDKEIFFSRDKVTMGHLVRDCPVTFHWTLSL